MADLSELAVRVEAATGPSYELDALIWCALNGVEHSTRITRDFEMGQAARYTASLDAAMTLVGDKEFKFRRDHSGIRAIVWNPGRNVGFDAEAATLPLSICAAALRSRSVGL